MDVDDSNYQGDLEFRSWGAHADFYPFKSAFHISAGLCRSRNRVNLMALPSRPASIGGMIYTPEQIGIFGGEVRVRKVAPTFTLGVASNVAWRTSD